MRVLHITNWYYSKEEPHKVPFIREHLESLQPYCKNQLIHIEIKDDGRNLWKKYNGRLSDWESFRLIKTKKMPWRFKELLSSRLLLQTLKEIQANDNFDIINIHTAYPLCSKMEEILEYLNIPIAFTEHWTAFEFNFNLPEKTKSLNRIRKIYQQNIPVLTVSKALAEEIERFAQAERLTTWIVPNVIDKKIFHLKGTEIKGYPSFFMVNYWRDIKSPLIIFDAFREFLSANPKAKLRVGGYGPLWADMESYVEKHALQENIILLGKLSKESISKELQEITAFVHAAKHETFSVVTAEALMCGTPVVVSNLPCIAEFVDGENGILVNNNLSDWVGAFHTIFINNKVYNRENISKAIEKRFSKKAVGGKYFSILQKIVSGPRL